MDNQKILLYGALSFILFLLWQAWQQDYGQNINNPLAGQAQLSPTSADTPTSVARVSGDRGVPTGADLPKSMTTLPLPTSQATLKSSDRIHVTTDLLDLEIDAIGGDLRRVDLRAYPVTVDQPEVPFRLFADDSEHLFIAQGGFLGDIVPNHHSLYQADQFEYHLAADENTLQVPLQWHDPSGIEVTKTYTFQRNSYQVAINYQIKNRSNAVWHGQLYAQLQRTEPTDGKSAFGIYTYTGGVVSSPDNTYDKIDFSRMKKETLSRDFKSGWLAMIQHYFAAAFIPPADIPIHAYTKVIDGKRYVLGYTAPEISLPAGNDTQIGTQLYVGPKEQQRLKQSAPNLELTVDYGKLTFIAQPIYWLLSFIQSGVSNWGWAIILLTVLIKLAFFHLSAKSYQSMAQMRKLTPRIQALKERYGEDRQKMNEAMMEMYRKEKINPLGGCLPIIVQIPVFIALYWVLVESVELRQAPWMFWIHDLSTQDPYYVLPLIMGVTMFLQQQLSPAPPDPMQAKIMMAMPIIFTGMFLFFPSGLVLYWVVNNGLSISQQWYITNKLIKE